MACIFREPLLVNSILPEVILPASKPVTALAKLSTVPPIESVRSNAPVNVPVPFCEIRPVEPRVIVVPATEHLREPPVHTQA